MKLSLPTVPPDFNLGAILDEVAKRVSTDPTWSPLKYVLAAGQSGPNKDRGRLGGVHPSDIGRDCQRSYVYAIINAERHRPPNPPQLQRTFDHGTVLHVLVQAYLQEAAALGLLEWARPEVDVHDPAIPIVGTADVLIGHGGNKYVVEVKSAGPSTFYGTKDLSRATSMITSVSVEYRKQFLGYLAATGYLAGFFVYWDKALDALKSIYVSFDQKLWVETRLDIDLAKELVRRGTLPARTSKLSLCQRCPFKDSVCDRDAGVREAARVELSLG